MFFLPIPGTLNPRTKMHVPSPKRAKRDRSASPLSTAGSSKVAGVAPATPVGDQRSVDDGTRMGRLEFPRRFAK